MKIVVKGAWSDSDARRFTMMRADHVELNHAKGFDTDSSLAFLGDLEGLRRLTVIIPGTADLSAISRCRQLEQLNLDVSRVKKPLVLGGLDRLRDLAVEKPTMVSDLYELTALTSLLIGRYPETRLTPLRKLADLRSLRLYQARELLRLEGLEHLTYLTELELAGARKLTDVSALAAAQELRKLDVSNAVGVGDWSTVGQLGKLQWLSFEDVKVIDSVDFVMRLRALEKFFATGITKVADGRVAQLGQHRSLRKVVLAESPQHDTTDRQIQKKLGGFSLF